MKVRGYEAERMHGRLASLSAEGLTTGALAADTTCEAMEKGDFRRERLAELGIDRLQRPPEKVWSARTRQMQDRWHRVAAGGWERTFFIVASVLAVVVAGVGVIALATRGGGEGGGGSVSAESRPTVIPAQEAATPTAITIGVPDIPTALPTETALPEPTEEGPDRTNCEAIRGTPYRSATERAWYEEHCGASVSNPPSGPGPVANTPVPPPTAIPPTSPPQGLTEGEVISLAVQWMRTSAPKAYTVDAGTCSSVGLSGHWIVSCSARLAGCTTAACVRELQVCVFADRRVVSAASC